MQLHLVAVLCCLATGFAVSAGSRVTWCTISKPESEKCAKLAQRIPDFHCLQRNSLTACLISIKLGEADAITLNAENIYKAGQNNYNLVPIIAEKYSSANVGACSYSVAVAKKGTTFSLAELRQKRSCHSGYGTPEGWILPIGTLLNKGIIDWEGTDTKSLSAAVTEFFSATCVPGATGDLINLCGSDSTNSYSGGDGAFKCLKDNVADVAFLHPAHIPENERQNYELLCQDNTRKGLDEYRTCNLGEEPASAVVTRRGETELAQDIWTKLTTVRGIDLFSSDQHTNLMFSDATTQLLQVPTGTDRFLYLGFQYKDKLQSLSREQAPPPASPSIRWCAVGHDEKTKCDSWSGKDDQDGIPAIACQTSSTVEECFKKIMRKEADAMAVDGGQVYTAGKCGLVPAMAEQYDEAICTSGNAAASSYYAVAVIKRGSGVTWNNLQGKRSCHTGMGRTAGWNIPMGHVHRRINSCDFSQFFSTGCAPGAEPTSTFCRNCKGSGQAVGGDEAKCKASAAEQYYGYAGAFRCLAEGNGDVAFIKHTIVGENTDGHGAQWAREMNLMSADFQLICPKNPEPVEISQFTDCNLALVPAHAVVTRPEIKNRVVEVLTDQQTKFGRSGTQEFRMFDSNGQNLLFKDSTKCLQDIQTDSYETFLGSDYMNSMRSIRECTNNTPDLEKSCTFQTCQ